MFETLTQETLEYLYEQAKQDTNALIASLYKESK